ncbi:phage tail protein [Escherichia coli]|nr:phage tail protein [Escherichia coli]
MAMPRKLKLMNVFLNGYSYQGVAKSVTLPKLTRKLENYRGAGMNGSAPVDLGLDDDALSMEWALGGFPDSVIGKRDAFQFLGVGEENITLAGVLYPELTGGKLTMTTLRLMAEEGRAWPLLDGTGMIYGMYVISKVSETGSIFFADGTPRKIDFTLSLTRVDESLAALYGDIGKQAESLIGKAGSMATKFTGMTGAG